MSGGSAAHKRHHELSGPTAPGLAVASSARDGLAHSLSELARSLEAVDDTETMLHDLVAAAVAEIPGVQEGSVNVVLRRRDVTSHSPSGELPKRVDALQAEVGEGPCLDAVFTQRLVRVPDMSKEQRWPRFAGRAAEAGAASMLSLRLWVEGDNLGALNLYSRKPHAFDDESEEVGLLFASHAAVALAGAQKQDQLAASMATRDLIGQAKGMLMERYQIDAQRAFAVMVRVSQDSNRKLRDVATELTTTGHVANVPPAALR
ncbi:MAG TPA: GAF and ANTAR domain-containing protein [Propionibacteriaceae bacterium]|nr:GAF and ANTAR domain-containing protein [Propionibacteriaceae bacterium]